MKNAGLFICLTVCILAIPYGFVAADIFNGGFELYDPNSGENYDTPIGWQRTYYGSSITQMEPVSGRFKNWNLGPEGLQAIEGERFAMVSTDLTGFDRDGSGDSVPFGRLRQTVEILGGERISGSYFFGTYDWIAEPPQFNDIARIYLTPEDPNSPLEDIILVQVEVEDVGDFSSMHGWTNFVYFFDESQAGRYDLVLEAEDTYDTYYASMLAVDDLILCDGPAYGDLNYDCINNYIDFEMLAQHWGKNCMDPNTLCEIEDIDGLGIIDIEDLRFYSETWLGGELIDPNSP